MANPESEPIFDAIVRAEFDPLTTRITVRPSHIMVRPGDLVLWQFPGLPVGWFPDLSFAAETTTALAGPFAQLSQSFLGIAGRIPDDVLDQADCRSFDYRAVARAWFGSTSNDQFTSCHSPRSELSVVRPGAEDPGGSEAVPVEVTIDESSGKLRVHPQKIRIFAGQTVEWTLGAEMSRKDAAIVQPGVIFSSFREKRTRREVAAPQLGPFATFTTTRTTVTATGNAHNPSGRYTYRVILFERSTGQIVWVTSGDPVIDDVGDPSGQPPGG